MEGVRGDVSVLRTDIDAKLHALEQEVDQKISELPQPQPVMTSKSQPRPTWQESSVKKIETKKVGGWAEVRMTKIEPRDMMHSLRSSAIDQRVLYLPRCQHPL